MATLRAASQTTVAPPALLFDPLVAPWLCAYVSVQDGDTVFDFGGNDQLTLTGITNLDALTAVISIV